MGNSEVMRQMVDGVIADVPVVIYDELMSRLLALPEHKLKDFGRYLDFLTFQDNGAPALDFVEKDS